MTKVAQPRSIEQATALLERSALFASQIALVEAERSEAHARTDAAADAVIAPLVEARSAIVTALAPWWAKAGAGLLTGKRKSIELGGCVIGTAVTAERVEFTTGDDKAALKALEAKPVRGATQIKRSLDKKAIAALLKGKTAAGAALKALGFRIAGGEDAFFVKPAGSAEAKVSAS